MDNLNELKEKKKVLLEELKAAKKQFRELDAESSDLYDQASCLDDDVYFMTHLSLGGEWDNEPPWKCCVTRETAHKQVDKLFDLIPIMNELRSKLLKVEKARTAAKTLQEKLDSQLQSLNDRISKEIARKHDACNGKRVTINGVNYKLVAEEG